MPTISAGAYDKRKQSGSSYIMLDVRNQDEYEAGHLDEAHLIPLHLLPLKAAEALPDKQTLIITCCQHGGRASQAAAWLVNEGYTDVRVLEGGYQGYIKTGRLF